MKINHIALWANDIELLRMFYVRYFGAIAGEKYHNPVSGFTSYFLTFPGGDTRIEIMNVHEIIDRNLKGKFKGFCHIAISLGSKKAVDEMTDKMHREGIIVLGNPRTTGDGYYESVIADPEGNVIELTI